MLGVGVEVGTPRHASGSCWRGHCSAHCHRRQGLCARNISLIRAAACSASPSRCARAFDAARAAAPTASSKRPASASDTARQSKYDVDSGREATARCASDTASFPFSPLSEPGRCRSAFARRSGLPAAKGPARSLPARATRGAGASLRPGRRRIAGDGATSRDVSRFRITSLPSKLSAVSAQLSATRSQRSTALSFSKLAES